MRDRAKIMFAEDAHCRLCWLSWCIDAQGASSQPSSVPGSDTALSFQSKTGFLDFSCSSCFGLETDLYPNCCPIPQISVTVEILPKQLRLVLEQTQTGLGLLSLLFASHRPSTSTSPGYTALHSAGRQRQRQPEGEWPQERSCSSCESKHLGLSSKYCCPRTGLGSLPVLLRWDVEGCYPLSHLPSSPAHPGFSSP